MNTKHVNQFAISEKFNMKPVYNQPIISQHIEQSPSD